MNPKVLAKTFKAAPWKNPAEIDSFVAAAAEVNPSEFIKLLEMLSNKALAENAQLHVQRGRVFQKLIEAYPDKRLFLPLVRTLKSAEPQIRNLVAPLLVKVNDTQQHLELCNLLRLKDAAVRKIAAQILVQTGGKTALRALDQMLRERDFLGRMEAIDIVAQVAGHYAIPSLKVAAEIGNVNEQMHALKYLGEPRFMSKAPAEALAALEPYLGHKVDAVAARAVAAYCSLCSEDQYFANIAPVVETDKVRIIDAAVRGLQRFTSPRVYFILERKMLSGPRTVRLAVLDVLESIGTDDVLPSLVQALNHRQIAVRTRAGEILAQLSRTGKLDIARTVVWLLRSPDVTVRRMAAELTNSITDPDHELWPKLIACLRDEDWWVRERVLDALLNMQNIDLTRHIVAYLSDPSEVIRRFGVVILNRLKDPRAVGALVSVAMNDTDWWVRECAIQAVADLNDQRTIPHIVNLMMYNAELQLVCLEALAKLRAKTAAPQVVKLLQADDKDVVFGALECLAALQVPETAPAVRPLLKETDPKIRNLAREVLTRWQIQIDQGTGDTLGDVLSPLDRFLVQMAKMDADDLILTPNEPVFIKKVGAVQPITEKKFSSEELQALVLPVLSAQQMDQLSSLKDVDMSYEVKSHELRFRVNVFRQYRGLSAVFRIVKGELPELTQLGLPAIVQGLGDMKNGLVLFGGPTGSGKSTSLAAIIDKINQTSARHIISLEDPIEVRHQPKTGLVNQREIGAHATSYSAALRSTLREDPDVILIGEMRDLPTISFAVSAAETGHLVFGTVHTVSAETTVDRLINTFPPDNQDQVRTMLAESLSAVVCQYLIPRKDKAGRVLAVEIMINNDAIANLIRKGSCYQIPSVLQTSREAGMQLMDHDLMRLFKEGKVSLEEAYVKARNKKEFEEFFEHKEDAAALIMQGAADS